MKKMIFLLLAALLTTAVSAQDYYTTKRNVEELVPVTRRNIVMLGNSLTERGFWSEYFPDKRVLNRGIGGDRIVGMLARLAARRCRRRGAAGRARAIFIMAGVNDLVFTDISNEDLLGQYERMLDIIADKSPRTKVYIQSALPVDESRGESLKGKNVRIAEFNALLQKAAAARGLQYIDIWSSMAENGQLPEKYHFDGIHLKADGYKVWIDKIRPYVK